MAFPKVTVKQNLFQKLGQDKEGRYTKGLTVNLINSEGTYTPDKGEKAGVEQSYSKDTIQIIVSKLDYQTGEVAHTGKLDRSGKPYSARDEVKMQVEIEQFKEFLFSASDILEAL